MSKDFSKGDRVVVVKAPVIRGTVVESKNMCFQLQKGYRVQIDGKSIEEILEYDLERETLNHDEIKTEIINLKKMLKELSPKLPKEVEENLDRHLTELQQALISSKKAQSKNEYNYILEELSRSYPEIIKNNLSLKKLNHYYDKCLR